jgi:hypothetical protein
LSFMSAASGHGWVVYSWSFEQGGSTGTSPVGDNIYGVFILTNATSPNGYVTAYYDIQNADVIVSPVTTIVTINCPSFATTSTT